MTVRIAAEPSEFIGIVPLILGAIADIRSRTNPYYLVVMKNDASVSLALLQPLDYNFLINLCFTNNCRLKRLLGNIYSAYLAYIPFCAVVRQYLMNYIKTIINELFIIKYLMKMFTKNICIACVILLNVL